VIYIKLLLTAIFWGGTFIAGKMIAQSVHPVSAAFLRFTIASVCLFVIVIVTQGRLPALRKNQFLPVVLLGLTGVFAYNILFFSGLKYIEAGRASLIIAINPIIISLLSALLFKERLNWIKGTGICLSVTGAMVVISHGRLADMASYTIGLGEVLIFGCVLCWAAYSLIGKVAMKSLSPLVSVAYASFVGTGLLVAPALYCGILSDISAYTVIDWITLFYLGFFGTVLGFFWYYQGIERIGPMKASVFINFVPISAIILSFFFLQEPLTAALLVGAGLVMIGVYFTNASQTIVQFFRKSHRCKSH
jgi:drug/metabolite transporter (DMT)-like permease